MLIGTSIILLFLGETGDRPIFRIATVCFLVETLLAKRLLKFAELLAQ